MKNAGASAPHAIIVCIHVSGLVVDIRIARVFTSMLIREKEALLYNNICYEKKKELGTCTNIEIKGTCGTTEVITASMAC